MSPVLLHRAFAPASLPSLTRGISLSPSRLRSKTHAGGSAPGSPSLQACGVASVGPVGSSDGSAEHRGGGDGGCSRSVRVFRHFGEQRASTQVPGEKVERRDICRPGAGHQRGEGPSARMVVCSGEPSAAPPGVRFGIPAFAHSRFLTFAFQGSLEDPRRWFSTGLPLAAGVWSGLS